MSKGDTRMSVRPICFMIMPYGTKPTQQRDGQPAPLKVNFDRLWDGAIRPAITALGYDPVRADQDLGALIISRDDRTFGDLGSRRGGR